MENKTLDLSDAVLSRKLEIYDEERNVVSYATILIGRPTQVDEDTWSCPYCITGLSEVNPSIYKVNGVDGIQALRNAFVVMEGTLSGTELAKQGRLCWIGNSTSGFLR